MKKYNIQNLIKAMSQFSSVNAHKYIIPISARDNQRPYVNSFTFIFLRAVTGLNELLEYIISFNNFFLVPSFLTNV